MKNIFLFSLMLFAFISCKKQNTSEVGKTRAAASIKAPSLDKGISGNLISYIDNDATPTKVNCRTCNKSAWSGDYKNSNGESYTICKDQDGYLVTDNTDGSNDAHGTGYSWSEVKEQYLLKGVAAFDCSCNNEC